MFRLRLLVLTCAFGVLLAANNVGVGQDAKKDSKEMKESKKDVKEAKPEGKVRGQLPQNWGKLGLSDDQKQTVYKTRAKFGDQIDELEAKIKAIKADEKKELEKILTPEQKKRLLELQTGEKATEKK
jgi:hypothetical protein